MCVLVIFLQAIAVTPDIQKSMKIQDGYRAEFDVLYRINVYSTAIGAKFKRFFSEIIHVTLTNIENILGKKFILRK